MGLLRFCQSLNLTEALKRTTGQTTGDIDKDAKADENSLCFCGDDGALVFGGKKIKGLSADEQDYLDKQLEEQLKAKFTVNISFASVAPSDAANSPRSVQSATFNLVSKYDGTNVDLDSTPSGWTRAGIGTYTKTVNYTKGATSIGSGTVNCTYTKISGKPWTKQASGASYSVKAMFAIINSNALPTGETIYNGAELVSSKPTNRTFTGANNTYTYFCIQNCFNISDVKQLGLSIMQKTGGVITVNDVSYNGFTFHCYRTNEALANKSYNVDIV